MQALAEATNYKETPIIRTLKEGIRAINFLDRPFIRPLADMHYTNIEGPSLLDSLPEYMDYYSHLHILDDNRAYLDLGSLDFAAICRELVESGYRGIVVVEGNIQYGLPEDTQICAAYLYKVCGGLYTPSHVSCHVI